MDNAVSEPSVMFIIVAKLFIPNIRVLFFKVDFVSVGLLANNVCLFKWRNTSRCFF